MRLNNLPAQELIERCIAMDQAAWPEFMRRYNELIVRVALKTVRRWSRQPSPSLIDDLVQDTYIKLCDKDCYALRRFTGAHENAIFGYLKVITSNVVQDHFRRGINRVEEEEILETQPGNEDFSREAESYIFRDEAIQLLRHELEDDPHCERNIAIFLLYYVQEFTAREIAELHCLQTKAVENIILRLVRVLRLKLNRPLK